MLRSEKEEIDIILKRAGMVLIVQAVIVVALLILFIFK